LEQLKKEFNFEKTQKSNRRVELNDIEMQFLKEADDNNQIMVKLKNRIDNLG